MKIYQHFTLFALALTLSAGTCISQSVNEILDEYNEEEATEIGHILQALVPHPFKINQHPKDSLATLWFLNTVQVEALVSLHDRLAPAIEISHISDAIQLPPEICELLFQTSMPRTFSIRGYSRFIQRGDGMQNRASLQFANPKITAGFSGERDAGEPRLDDYTSGYLMTTRAKKNMTILGGNYTLRSAHGLVFAGNYGVLSLSQSGSVLKSYSPQIIPYRSSHENLAFRGIAVAFDKDRYKLIVAGSTGKRDGKAGEKNTIVSRPIDGYHRTESELAARKALGENMIGFASEFRLNTATSISLNGARYTYSHSIENQDSVRRHFAFEGGGQLIGSVGISIQAAKGLSLGGEFASTQTGQAYLIGMTSKSGSATISISYWFGSPSYNHTHGAIPGKFIGTTSNIRQYYIGAKTKNKIGEFRIYATQKRAPWRSFRLPHKHSSETLFVRWQKRIGRGAMVGLRTKVSATPEFFDFPQSIWQPSGKGLTKKMTASHRLEWQLRMNAFTEYRGRIEYLEISAPYSEHAAQQSHYIQTKIKDIRTRWKYAFFKTGSYASRIYDFDYALPGLIQPTALSGEGERVFISAGTRFLNKLAVSLYASRMWVKGAQTKTQYGFHFELKPTQR